MRKSVAAAAREHPATEYAEKVIAGEILAGKWVRLACERHMRDLIEGPERGLIFDVDAANHAIDFYGYLRHTKAEWAGQPIVLELWQQFCTGSEFGWLQEWDGLRRFREVYEEICRKNGKSLRASATALYLFVADGEAAPEVYATATTVKQAKIVFRAAKKMAQMSPPLRRRIGIYENKLTLPDGGEFIPIGAASADSLDGPSVSAAIIDEYHAHKSRDAYDVIDTGTDARQQPMMVVITTAPGDPASPCAELSEYAEKVLEGVLDNDQFFAYIACIDEGDDWADPAVWPKANPNLGVSVDISGLQRKARKAKANPSAQPAFRNRHCGEKVDAKPGLFTPAQWKACSGGVEIDTLFGRECYGGLDLSSRVDLAAFELIFPPDDPNKGPWPLLTWIFCAEDNVQEMEKRDRVPYGRWIEQGHLIATPGNSIDQDVIRKQINTAGAVYDIREIGVDPWGSAWIEGKLIEDGFTVFKIRQGLASMSPPTKDFEVLVRNKQLRHFGHPVLKWMASNVKVRGDSNDNYMPCKKMSRKRIDGIVAAIMAKDRADRNQEIEDGDSYGSDYQMALL